jgi:hypothetical protein
VRDDKQGIRRVGVDGGAVTRESTNRETVFNQHGTLDDDVMHDAKVLSLPSAQ